MPKAVLRTYSIAGDCGRSHLLEYGRSRLSNCSLGRSCTKTYENGSAIGGDVIRTMFMKEAGLAATTPVNLSLASAIRHCAET